MVGPEGDLGHTPDRRPSAARTYINNSRNFGQKFMTVSTPKDDFVQKMDHYKYIRDLMTCEFKSGI